MFIPGFGGVRVVTYISNTASVLIIRSRNCLSFRSSCVHPRVLVGSVLLHKQVIRRLSYKKQELFFHQELPCSSPGFGWVRVVTYISNTASVLCEVGTVYPPGSPVFIPGFW